jgi:hypothetical protein
LLSLLTVATASTTLCLVAAHRTSRRGDEPRLDLRLLSSWAAVYPRGEPMPGAVGSDSSKASMGLAALWRETDNTPADYLAGPSSWPSLRRMTWRGRVVLPGVPRSRLASGSRLALNTARRSPAAPRSQERDAGHREEPAIGCSFGAAGIRGRLQSLKSPTMLAALLAPNIAPADDLGGSSPWPPKNPGGGLARSVSSPRGPWSRLIVAVDRQIWVGPRWGPMFLAMSPS